MWAPVTCCDTRVSKKMEVENGGNTLEPAQPTEDNQAQPGKKRKLNKYFRVHAHRNPLSDGEYEQYAIQ